MPWGTQINSVLVPRKKNYGNKGRIAAPKWLLESVKNPQSSHLRAEASSVREGSEGQQLQKFLLALGMILWRLSRASVMSEISPQVRVLEHVALRWWQSL